ncbi:glycosyltransferase family 25 protein [Vibrio vulnificus]|nr:glycosyltransferase family 25 protein [Vibrio vulnificus]EKO5199871.1 glycosyltransferase family 25 protein [Vibrio vulnificus]
MNIRVVSLVDSKNRLPFSSRFNPLEFEFFDALLGGRHKKSFNESLFQFKYNRVARDGEIGCTLSHYIIIKELIETNLESMIILEDDAIPVKEFFDFYADLFLKNNKPSIFLLGHSKTREKDLWLQRLKQPLKEVINLNGFSFGINHRITECGTVGYIINRKAAEIISAYDSPYWLADDWKFFEEIGIHVYHPVKPLIYEDLTTVSTTGNAVCLNHSIYNKTLLQIGSVVKSRLFHYLNK